MSNRFPTTHWSELADLRDANPDGEALLFARLYERYWQPLYAYLRRRGNSPDHAADLLQGFFTFLLDKRVMATFAPKGKLRAFLLASLKNYVADEWDKQRAQKRRPEKPLLSLDFDQAENLFLQVPSKEETPDEAYERRWALAMIDRAVERLSQFEREAGRAETFVHLRPYVVGGAEARPYRELAEELEVSEGTLKVRVSRMRKRLTRYLKEDVAMTVPDAAGVQPELEHLSGLVG